MRLFLFFIVLMSSYAQTGHAEQKRDRLLMLDLKATLIEEQVVGIITNMVSAELANYNQRFEIITSADMRQMVALEAEKQSMGCVTDSSCLAELAGAMGARLVLFGGVGKLGNNIIITLNLFDSVEATSAGRVIIRASDLDVVPDKVPPALAKLVSQFVPNAPNQFPTPSTSAAPTPPPASGNQTVDTTETTFPWLAVLGLTTVAVAGGTVAGLYGLPAYETAISSEKAYQAVKNDGTQQSIDTYDQAQDDQADFFAGPVYGLVGGALVGLTAASVALYLTGDALSRGSE